MSRVSSKMRVQKDLRLLFLITSIESNDVLESDENEDDETLTYLFLFEKLKQQRYLSSRVSVLKSNWASSILFKLSETRFRDYVRMSRHSLNSVVYLIKNDAVFQNQFTILQTSVINQLKYVLYRLDHDDSVSESLVTAIFWDVSKEHVFDCIKRVIEILCRLKNKFVQWSDARARTKENLINNKREKDFIDVVEKMNEIDIVLIIKSRDVYEEELFFNRKKRYAMNLCANCNFDNKFIYFLCN
jgi:predicted DNA-binding protein YlxM (UPF0122 family)